MTVVILNPNSTETMTRAMVEAARLFAPEFDIEGQTSRNGPPAIQGREDGEAATAPLLAVVETVAATEPNGLIIGCFDDTALSAVQSRVKCPVVGLGQAAYALAAMRGWKFSVVTTLSVSIPILEENIGAYGFGALLGRVRASDIPVLSLDADPAAACLRIQAEAERAIAEDGAEAIVLGCAGMVHVTRALRAALPCPVIDPVEAAVGCIGWLCRGTGASSAPGVTAPPSRKASH